MKLIRNLVALACFAAAVSVCRAVPNETAFTITLPGALFLRDAPIVDGPTLVLDLRKSGNRWERVWGFAGDFHINSPHPGRVVSGNLTDDQIQLTLEMDIQSGSWARGGRAKYEVAVQRTASGDYAGTYSGEFRGVPVTGKATAVFKPTSAQPPAGFAPTRPGEHPRLLFRKSDLQALREKAKTPLGEAALAKMGWSNPKESDVVGLGLKYQLTGDRNYAEEAIFGVEKLMGGWLYCDQYGNNVGDRAAKMAFAFDLYYDVWPEAFKRRVRRYLLFDVTGVQFLNGGTVQGEATSPPWQFVWRKPPVGAHVVHAIWKGNQVPRATANPALLVVRRQGVKQ